jgi:hypothetical protein
MQVTSGLEPLNLTFLYTRKIHQVEEGVKGSQVGSAGEDETIFSCIEHISGFHNRKFKLYFPFVDLLSYYIRKSGNIVKNIKEKCRET